MRRSDFNFELPAELIAQVPLEQRSAARLLDASGLAPRDREVRDLPQLLGPEDLLIFNDTRVIPARLHGRKASGGKVEIMLDRVASEQRAWAFIRASKSPKPQGRLLVGETEIQVLGRDGELFLLHLENTSWTELLEREGEVPLPPYIQRQADDSDRARYQTVFAREAGAVAAPTAGLHFDQALLAAIDARGAQRDFVTLHVGAGTFAPIRTENLDQHTMHAERLEVRPELVARINDHQRAGGRVVAIGTTVVRALETAAADGELKAFTGESRLFIRPGYRFRVVDALLTNFHLPESTLLMLVCAFSGQAEVLAAYRHAVEQCYRFFSYGDAMWLTRRESCDAV